uniref:Serine aminopeptidase S33 domain-containing protein n=1 Tax=Leersia perrieri TaxID=77586 RepID=A0A0D9WFN1_9ORYZ
MTIKQMMDGVEYHEEYVTNPRGLQLFTCGWLPANSSPKALVFLCHGYGMEVSGFMKGIKSKHDAVCSNGGGHCFLAACGIELATAGYGVFGIDYEGHGKSMGARCYIQKFEHLVDDCDRFFKSICDLEECREKSRFLYGESMGGAVALLLHRKDPTFWDGAVLVAPMCKISEKVKPHPVVVTLLTQVEDIIPKWKIVPTKDVIDSAFKDPVKREKIRKNKLIYQDKPRLKTALELLRTSMDVEDSLSQVSMAFFILHGEADTVTDPEVSRALYERAASGDKTIKLYPGMWHGLTAGEPDDNVRLVFSDIVAWLNERSGHHRHRRHGEIHSEMARADSSPVSVRGPPPPGHAGGFLCGLTGRGNHQQCRM